MDKLKQFYDKIILGVVLLAVAVTAFLLTFEVQKVKDDLASQLKTVRNVKQKEFKPVDLTSATSTLERLSKPVSLELSGEHNTFNAGTWEKGKDGQLFRKKAGGALGSLSITRINPLYLAITNSGATGLGDTVRYQFMVAREYDKSAAKRKPALVSLTENAKNDLFILREVKGAKDSPTELVCELVDGGERFILTKEKPGFTKVMGYSADLRYESGSDKKDFNGRRIDETIVLGGQSYKIVAIGKDELVVSAPNHVRTTIKATSAL